MNYKKYLLGVLFILFSIVSYSQEVKLTGIHQGESLYLVNPFSSGSDFCIESILVNGKKANIDLKVSTIEVNLDRFNLKVGDNVSIIVKHKKGCKPKFLNPKVIKVRSSFEVKSMRVGRDKILRWTTVNESGSLDYIVEQYRWKKWSKIGVVKGTGKQTINKYEIKISDHSGENKFRVKQIDYTKRARYSKNTTYHSLLPTVTYKKSGSKIIFSHKTTFEIYDYYGKINASGNAKEVDISKLKTGEYFLNYDNKMDMFKKK